MTPTEEDFIAWRENVMTQWFFNAYRTTAALTEAEWKEASWTTGVADQEALNTLKAKHAAYSSVYLADFTDIEARQEEE
jgi:hypothetical protein